MYSWQKNLCNEVMSGGIAKGELMVITASRGAGKSQLSQYMKMFTQIYYKEVPCVELGNGTVFGQTYYTVEPKGIVWKDMEEWCKETFGSTPTVGIWEDNARWYMNDSRFWFRDEKDRTLFVLRWSR